MSLKRLIPAGCIIAAASLGAARAGSFDFNFTGSGVTGSIQLTYDVNPNTGVLPGTSPNPVDPIGSYIVTGISGTFSDSNIGLLNASITSIEASNPAHPEPANLLAPASFGFYIISHGVHTPDGTAPGFSYDNLFYPGGSPQAASDYPFHGGFFDIYGLIFHTDSGKTVNLWSDGDFGGGPTYGAGVTDGTDVLDYVDGLVPVPEPAAPEPDPAPAGRRSAQEREIEEAMKALRGLIEDEVQPDLPAPQPPPTQPKPRAGKPRPVRSGSGAPDAPPPAAPSEEARPGSEPTPLSKTIAALRGMLELDGRRKR